MEIPRNFLIFVAMKKMMLLAAAALLSGSALAQTLSLKVPENVPAAAREVLVQRFTQMLQGAGVTVGEEGETLFIEGKVTDRMVTPGSASQTALSISAVAESVGYEDSLYFSRVFRNEFGVSPQAYRIQKHP